MSPGERSSWEGKEILVAHDNSEGLQCKGRKELLFCFVFLSTLNYQPVANR
jgi:hypothetical protein